MLNENNLVNQFKKFKEDLDIDVSDTKGYRLNEYTYILGDTQKKMIIDADLHKPYDTFRYYFLQANPTMEADKEVLEGCFGERWELNHNNYQNFKIICDDIVYANKIEDTELIDKIIRSIDELSEDFDLDYPDEKGELRRKNQWATYLLGTQEKVKFIKWFSSIPDIEKRDETVYQYPSYIDSDDLHEHINGKWALGMYDKERDSIQCVIVDDLPERYFTMLMEFPIERIKEFVLDYNVDELIKIFREEGTNDIVKEDLDIDQVDTNWEEVVAQALAERIGDCIVDKNIVYQLMNDFEVWDDSDAATDSYRIIPYGIFAIYEVLPTGGVIAYESNPDRCQDVDGIGHKGLNYYRSNPSGVFPNIAEFIKYLNGFFGIDWFGTPEEVREFIDEYSLKEDLIG